jgi:hypothetical protein
MQKEYIDDVPYSSFSYKINNKKQSHCIIIVTLLEIVSSGRRPPEMAGCPLKMPLHDTFIT